jgi:hypothetical protein
MTIMLNQDSDGSAPGNNIAAVDCGWCVMGMPLTTPRNQTGLQVLRLQASAAAPRLCAANDNQLAWPYLAFADDWYASC